MKNSDVSNAIASSYSWCLEPKEYFTVTNTIDYMLSAMDLSKEDILEILEMASGQDSIADCKIDELIEHYKGY